MSDSHKLKSGPRMAMRGRIISPVEESEQPVLDAKDLFQHFIDEISKVTEDAHVDLDDKGSKPVDPVSPVKEEPELEDKADKGDKARKEERLPEKAEPEIKEPQSKSAKKTTLKTGVTTRVNSLKKSAEKKSADDKSFKPPVLAPAYGWLRIGDKAYVEEQRKVILDNSSEHNSLVKQWVNFNPFEAGITELVVEPGIEIKKIIAYDLACFGNTIADILASLKLLVEQEGMEVVIIKNNLALSKATVANGTKLFFSLFSLVIDLEKTLASLRIREGIKKRKSKGEKTGKPKGILQKSVFDKDRKEIVKFLKKGYSIRAIAREMGYKNAVGLNRYIKTRNLKDGL